MVFGVVENDAVVPSGEFCRVGGKRCQFALVIENETAEGEAFADIVQDGGEENGIGPEVALVFLLFFAGKLRQFVLAAQGQGDFEDFEGVNKHAARYGVVMCL